MNHQASDRNYGQISASEKEGFVAVFPNGSSRFDSGKFATWNADNCCARDENVDVVSFIRRILVEIDAHGISFTRQGQSPRPSQATPAFRHR